MASKFTMKEAKPIIMSLASYSQLSWGEERDTKDDVYDIQVQLDQ